MIFYDFEVFKYDWLVVFKDTEDKKTTVIINNQLELEEFYNNHLNDIWCGYNSRSYDQYILKGILSGFNPKEINDFIIEEHRGGWEFSSLLHKLKFINYDVMTSRHGLKQLEGFLGNDIRESSVNFKIDRKLTEDEIKEVVVYCTHDVEQTMHVFISRIEEFKSHKSLISAFNLPQMYLNKTKPQLSAIILKSTMNSYDDEFDITIVDTIKLNTPEYQRIKAWYEDKNNLNYDKELTVNVAGVPHTFAWGGLHGAINNYMGEGIFLNVDVASYYPSLMIMYAFSSRSIPDASLYEQIYDTRLELKADKDPMQQPYKIVLNSTYGAMKDKYNNLYDPRQANNVCINGQLMLLDLIEKIEHYVQVIQTNTDGVLVKLKSEKDLDKVKLICKEWEDRTHMVLEYDLYSKVIQKDVNNYIIVDQNGEYKSKGAYVKKLNKLDYDLPIINEALINYFLKGIPVEITIGECTELHKFQKVVKISNKYDHVWHGNTNLQERVLRVFASKSKRDGGIFKQKGNGTLEKVSNTPEHSIIINDSVVGVQAPRRLDKNWYIDVARKRLADIIGG